MENEEHLDTFICKLLLMNKNAAGEITSPYTYMLYIILAYLAEFKKIPSEDVSIKIAEKKHLQI